MPPKRGREQLSRQTAAVVQTLAPEVIAKRTKRHLDELERSNYAEPTLLAGVGDEDEEGGNKVFCCRQEEKSTMNVRTALLYRKNLATLIEESNIASLPSSVPTYLTASTIPSAYPSRMLCSVCGYWGLYKCRRCAMPYCDLNCEGVHAETRCERRVV
ncbi:hypothetical protein BDZ97DRAFT_1903003 [Flammula alnicola]|nr:hypothetical protein BDZ97DRAFT_1903003 [Flammula alnicola]